MSPNWKQKKIRIPKILKGARNEDCTIMGPGCQNDTATSVWCHSPFTEHGKGMGVKAHDHLGAIGCAHCHDMLDGRTEAPAWWERFDAFNKAMARSWTRLLEKGVLK